MVLFLTLHSSNRGLWIYDCKNISSMDLSFCNQSLWYFSNSDTVYFCFFMKWGVLLAVQCPCFRVIQMKNTSNCKNYNVALYYKYEKQKDQRIYFDLIFNKDLLDIFLYNSYSFIDLLSYFLLFYFSREICSIFSVRILFYWATRFS